jgi:hypothetical protein
MGERSFPAKSRAAWKIPGRIAPDRIDTHRVDTPRIILVSRPLTPDTRKEKKVSEYQTYEIVVKVAIRVSAYDQEHAVDVASELLTPIAGVMFVKGNE